MNRKWTGKLQVTLLSAKLCSQTFKASSEEEIVMNSEKMKAKMHEGGCVEKYMSFFMLTCRLASRNFITD